MVIFFDRYILNLQRNKVWFQTRGNYTILSFKWLSDLLDIWFDMYVLHPSKRLWRSLLCDMKSWWRHQMETISTLLALCAENSPVTGEYPSQRPVNNRKAGDLRRHRAHYNVIVISSCLFSTQCPVVVKGVLSVSNHWQQCFKSGQITLHETLYLCARRHSTDRGPAVDITIWNLGGQYSF